MLAADKLQLQTTLKQQATALKEKEFKLHHENLMTVGTQAAVLAGLDVTMLIELTPALDSDWNFTGFEQKHLAFLRYLPRIVKFFYYVTISTAFCANILVVGQTTVLSVMGASLALRGPDGSMMTATDGLYDERSTVFRAFAYGLASTLGSVVLGVWLILPPEAAFVCMVCTCFTARLMRNHYRRVRLRFKFDEEDTVDFSDLFDGVGNVKLDGKKDKNTPRSKHHNRNGSRYLIKDAPHTGSEDFSSDDDALFLSNSHMKRRRGRANGLRCVDSEQEMSSLITV